MIDVCAPARPQGPSVPRLSVLHMVSAQYLKFSLSKAFEIFTQAQGA